MGLIRKAVAMNGVTHVVISKMDVLRELDTWKVLEAGEIVDLKDESSMKDYITDALNKLGVKSENVHFSEHKDKI